MFISIYHSHGSSFILSPTWVSSTNFSLYQSFDVIFFCRFGCPALLPKVPHTTTTPIKLKDCRELQSNSKSEKFDIIKSDEANAENSEINFEKVDPGSDSRMEDDYQIYEGIIQLYRGMCNADICLNEHSIKSKDSSSSDDSTSAQLPGVFALIRTYSKTTDNIHSTDPTVQWKVVPLSAAWSIRHHPDAFIIVTDTSSSSSALGWGTRNLLALLGAHTGSYSDNVDNVDSVDNLESKGPRSASTSPILLSNIIALRGSTARRMYACTSHETAVGLLNGLSDKDIGTSGLKILL